MGSSTQLRRNPAVETAEDKGPPPSLKAEDDGYLHPQTIKTAVDYYYALVEARNILTSTMGRALVRAGQCGGSVWCHLYAMHGEGKL